MTVHDLNDSMIHIEITNRQKLLVIDRKAVRSIVRTTLQAEQVEAASISIAILDNPSIHELNRQYLQHDYETDVLSFSLSDDEEPGEFVAGQPRGAGRTIEGEVIVSAEMAISMAVDYGWSAWDELTLYLVHGLLHLCGYDDLTEEELPVMRRREQEIFELLGLQPPVRDALDRGHLDDESSPPSPRKRRPVK